MAMASVPSVSPPVPTAAITPCHSFLLTLDVVSELQPRLQSPEQVKAGEQLWLRVFCLSRCSMLVMGGVVFSRMRRSRLYQRMPTHVCSRLAPKSLLLCFYSFGLDFWPYLLDCHCLCSCCFEDQACPYVAHSSASSPSSLSSRPHSGCSRGAAFAHWWEVSELLWQPTAFCYSSWAEPTVALAGGHSPLSSPGLINPVLGSCSVGPSLARPGLVWPWHGGWVLQNPHLSSRDSLYLSQPTPKRWPLLPFRDLWFTRYSSSLPQLPWQQHTLGPTGKIPRSDLAPVAGSRQAWTAGEGQSHDELDSEPIGAAVESLSVTVDGKAVLGKWLLFFLLLAINPCAPGRPQLGRLTPRWFLMAYVPTTRQARALPTQPHRESLLWGWEVPFQTPASWKASTPIPCMQLQGTVVSRSRRAEAWPVCAGNVSLCSEIWDMKGNLPTEELWFQNW